MVSKQGKPLSPMQPRRQDFGFIVDRLATEL
jgi:hypothetical protein